VYKLQSFTFIFAVLLPVLSRQLRGGGVTMLAISCTDQKVTERGRERERAERRCTAANHCNRTMTAKLTIIVWQISYLDIDFNNGYPDIG